MKILSLDIATTTGYALYDDSTNIFEYGVIETKKYKTETLKLVKFRRLLVKTMKYYKPDKVVMEDVYAGKNISTLKLLAKFAGVAQECCLSDFNIDPYIVHTSTVKSYFKVRNKEGVFDFMLELLDLDKKRIIFKLHNDMMDAVAQAIFYYDQVLGYNKFREEKEYGYLYHV